VRDTGLHAIKPLNHNKIAVNCKPGSIIELPFAGSIEQLYPAIRRLPYPVLLDSQGVLDSTNNRYSILLADPVDIFVANSTDTQSYYFSELNNALSSLPGFDMAGAAGLPFAGGLAGFWGYELGLPLNHLPVSQRPALVPDMQVGLYLWALVADRQSGCISLLVHPDCELTRLDRLLEQLERRTLKDEVRQPFRLTSEFNANMNPTQYRERFQRVIDYILAGDCYQVNLAQRFSAAFEGDVWQAYQRLTRVADAPFSAFIEAPDYQILSLSPERFVSLNQGIIETRPIKGTRPRDTNAVKDAQFRYDLETSAKDRAENLMIVDLLRNDLGKCAIPGSVEVTELFSIETYRNLYHMVSCIRARLLPEKTAIDFLQAVFPGGSITGAPKRRAMSVISELEPDRRGPYCGSIGYIDCNGRMDTNIAIRTLVSCDHQVHCWGGGGLVADSRVEEEYAESILKVQNLLDGLRAE